MIQLQLIIEIPFKPFTLVPSFKFIYIDIVDLEALQGVGEFLAPSCRNDG
jgi:hypothetical protein